MLKNETLFFELALKSDALLLGDFVLKSGKKSPYFFNVGSFFNQGFIAELSNLYTEEIISSKLEFDVIFGPAYKGIPLAAVISASLSTKISKPIPFAFNRKEVKAHGEGGSIVGELKDKKVLVVDDVLTAGTALKQSLEIISQEGGIAIGCLVALDREEIIDDLLARDKIFQDFNISVTSIAKISKLIEFLENCERQDEAKIIKNYLLGT
jgi:orotate phosphoribosyltransferase